MYLFRLLFLYFCFGLSSAVFAQVAQSNINTDITAPYNSAQYLVQNVLASGDITVANVVLTSGANEQIGYFEDLNPDAVFGFEEGFFMSTLGNNLISNYTPPPPFFFAPAVTAPDPDIANSIQELFGGLYSPAQDQNNLIVLEFDVLANSTFVEFYYSFASQEYTGYTCSSYNDVFGFYISGPNPNDPANPYVGRNIARVPTDLSQTAFKDVPIAVNSVNSGSPSGANSAPCDTADINWTDNSIFFVPNPGGNPTDFIFTGYTIPLRAFIETVCDEWYHFKLAICDVTDGALNSAVVLQKNSLQSPISVDFQAVPNVSPDTNGWFYEGCGRSVLSFKRPNVSGFEPGTGDLPIQFNLSGTADFGLDYVFTNSLNDSTIVIPNLDDEFILEIQPLEDFLVEPNETVVFEVADILPGISCSTDSFTTIELEIADHPEVLLDLPDRIVTDCPGDSVDLSLEIEGGIPFSSFPQYDVHWSFVGFDIEQVVAPEETTTYYVTVSDLCPEFIYRDSVIIEVAQHPELVLREPSSLRICSTEFVDIRAFEGDNVTGGNPEYSYEYRNVNTGELITTNPDVSLSYGEYRAVVYDECLEVTSEDFIIEDYRVPDVSLAYELTEDPLTVGFVQYRLPKNDNTFLMGLSSTYSFGDGTSLVHQGNPKHTYDQYGEYEVGIVLENELGCEEINSVTVDLQPNFFAPNAITANGDGANEGFQVFFSRGYDEFTLEIFSRWGERLFYTNDSEEIWYATDKSNALVTQGTYIFKASANYPGYGSVNKDGVVVVIK